MKKAYVIGWPINHSRSPLIHNHWIRQYGIDAIYQKMAVEPLQLNTFIHGLLEDETTGFNVTLPHKEAITGLVKPDEIATRVGAANTVYWQNHQLRATNTDGEGFIRSIEADIPQLSFHNKSALVIGAGGAARSIIDALLRAGIDRISLANRTCEKAQALASYFGRQVKAVDWSEDGMKLDEQSLLVNTTSLGMAGQPTLEINLDRLPVSATVADIVYVPQETNLLKQARQRGNNVSGGLGMLLYQAVKGFELWFGIRPEVTPELRKLVEENLRMAS